MGVPVWQRGRWLGSQGWPGRTGQVVAQLMPCEMCLGVLALPNIPFRVTRGACPQELPIPKVSPSSRSPYPQGLSIPKVSLSPRSPVPEGTPIPVLTALFLVYWRVFLPSQSDAVTTFVTAALREVGDSSGPRGAVGCAAVVGAGGALQPPYLLGVGSLGTPVPVMGSPTQ